MYPGKSLSKIVVSCLLILGSLTIPILAVSVFGQSWTTSTGIQTVTSTMTLTNGGGQSGSDVLSPVPKNDTCYYEYYTFTGEQNQAYSVRVTSNSSINVYILKASDFKSMLAADECPSTYSISTVAQLLDTQSGELDLTTPTSGSYYLIISNSSHNNAVQYRYNLNAIIPVLTSNEMNFTTTLNATSGGGAAITNYQTFTTTIVTTNHGYNQIISTMTYSQSLESGSFTITPTGQNSCGIYDNFPFTAQKNDVVVGTITSNVTVSFYIMTESQYQSWLTANGCPVFSAGLLEGAITSYNVSYVVPSDGKYEFLFLSRAKTYTAGVEFDASLVSGSTMVSVTSYSPFEQTLLITSTGSSSSVMAEQSSHGKLTSLLPFAIVAILVLIGLGLYLSKRKTARDSGVQTTIETTRPISPTQTDVKKSMMYCRKCGATIPRDSTFCKECGTTTT
ncbi:MAG: zinc ribbon domain-containing protein [Candidatus Bathyarchaeia archaeon]